jgi:hypothetical protein
MTILDSLDTIWLMGLTHEFDEAATWVENHLNLDKTSPVSTFEITIRALGGLLSAAQLSGRAGLLQKVPWSALCKIPYISGLDMFYFCQNSFLCFTVRLSFAKLSPGYGPRRAPDARVRHSFWSTLQHR